MKILELKSTNVKRLTAVEIRPDGRIIPITGPNGSGKSAILDSIAMALGGKNFRPSQPIRRGEQRATIRLDLGDIIVIRQFTPTKTTLVVQTPDGARYPSPEAFVDALVGELSFDPEAFKRLPAKAQLEALRRLVRVDVDLEQLDATAKQAYDERTEKNREVKSLTERVALLATAVHAEIDTTPEDQDALVNQLATASEHNAAVQRLRDERAVDERLVLGCEQEIARTKAEMTRLAAHLVDVEQDYEDRRLALANATAIPEPIDTALLRVAITDARAANAAREAEERARAAHLAAVNALQAARTESENLTATIDEAVATKTDAIARATMPIPGLSFGDGEITYNGVPLSQASNAEQIRVAVAIGMALNPKVRVLCIHDGSLLDKESLAIIAELAEQNDFQVWIEKVADERGTVGFSIEDGSVVAIDGEPVEADEPVLVETGD